MENPLQDPSVRYRCYHPAEYLMESGHFCSVVSAAKFFDNPCFDYDVYIFHRPNIARSKFLQVISALKSLNKRLIADYDDLIFGTEEIAMASSAVKNATLTPERAVTAFANNLAGLLEFDLITASTEPLLERVKQFNPDANVAVVPNIVPNSILTVHESIGTPLRPRPATSIGYFAGTKSHDKDFPIAAEVLHRVLLENPDFSLLIVGPVAIPSGLAALPNVSAAPVVNYFRLPNLMTMCATVIAPLENSAFNACKSRVKFLEAALTGCRLVASPIPDMCAIGEEHMDLAANANDWYEALSNPLGVNERADLAKRNYAFLRSHLNVHGLEVLGELK